MSFAALAHLTEGLCLSALLTLKVEKSIICLVGTRIIKFNLFIYVLDNSQKWPITAKHKNNSTG
jgi:hypothetical protein